jgi:hypothetical protein
MPAAIRPYSMAVAPLSSARNLAKIRFMCVAFSFEEKNLRIQGQSDGLKAG